MNDLIAASRQALEALIDLTNEMIDQDFVNQGIEAITALRTAIEAAEKQEPFGYFQYSMSMDAWVQNRDSNKGVAFYTTPPTAQRQWIGLTQQDIDVAFDDTQEGGGFNEFAYAIEQRLKEKNT